jgi:hypothetical protein
MEPRTARPPEDAMATDPPTLKRALFGYRRRTVRRLLADREIMAHHAEERLRLAEERAQELEQQLARTREEEPPPTPGLADVGRLEDILGRDLAVLRTAGEAAERIAALAAEAGKRQIEEAEQLRGDLRDQLDRLAAWQSTLEPAVRSLRESVEEARSRIQAVPELIREALTPLDEAVRSLDASLESLAAAAPPIQSPMGAPTSALPDAPPEAAPDAPVTEGAQAQNAEDADVIPQPAVGLVVVPDPGSAGETPDGQGSPDGPVPAEGEGPEEASPGRASLGDAWSARARWL